MAKKFRITDEQKIKYLIGTLKVLGGIAFIALNGLFVYTYLTANDAGRKRAE